MGENRTMTTVERASRVPFLFQAAATGSLEGYRSSLGRIEDGREG